MIALAVFVLMDGISTHILSDTVLHLLGAFTPDYADVGGVEAGVRMTSLFMNPNAGTYTLNIDADKPLTVMIESQNQAETMMHTSTALYEGTADGADSEVRQKAVTYAARLANAMEAWNAANIGTVALDDAAQAYLERYL